MKRYTVAVHNLFQVWQCRVVLDRNLDKLPDLLRLLSLRIFLIVGINGDVDIVARFV